MRTVLFGATDVTLAIAQKLRNRPHDLVGVVTVAQEFGISYSKTKIKNFRYTDMVDWSESKKISVLQFKKFDDVIPFLEHVNADFGLVAGWYHMVPKRIRGIFAKGCAGLHASLLPLYRGGAPLNWALLDGASETGVSLFELGDGVDDGPIYGQERFEISSRTTITDLVEQSKEASVKLVEQCLPLIASNKLRAVPQVGTPVYSLQRSPVDGRIDWCDSAENIDRLIRAVTHPYPGARTSFEGKLVNIWSVQIGNEPRILGCPGQITILPEKQFPVVVCGENYLEVRSATLEDGADALPTIVQSSNKRFV